MKIYEFDKRVITTINVPIKITANMLNDIIVTAFEGGIGYWAVLDNTDEPDDKGLFTSSWMTSELLEGKILKFIDVEDKDTVWSLTLNDLLNGVKLNANLRPHDCDLENMDSTTADCIIQYALFGEIVYG